MPRVPYREPPRLWEFGFKLSCSRHDPQFENWNDMKNKMVASLASLVFMFAIAYARSEPLLTVGSQIPATITPGGTATFALTISVNALGLIEQSLIVSNLPPGTTASISDVATVHDGNHSASRTATLTITTSASTPSGTYVFTVLRRNQNGANQVNTTGTLVIGATAPGSALPPTILSIQMLPDHTAQIVCSGSTGGTYWLQATTCLCPPSWSTIATQSADAHGLLTFIDADTTLYPIRFYRAALAQ